MKKVFLLTWVLLLALLTACGSGDKAPETSGDDTNKLQVIASFTIISDMAGQIGGDKVSVHNLVPSGTDPHNYEPLPEDIKKATDADVLFYNGLNLEGGEHGWFFKMMDTVGQNMDHVFNLTTEVTPLYLTDEATRTEEINPHAFIDPEVGILMAKEIVQAYIEVDPENKAYYEEQASIYLEKLESIAADYKEKLNGLPEENKILVTSECAFQYMLERYGLEEACIWKVDTEENGSPAQIKSLLSFVEQNNVPVLFLESNVDDRPMTTISEESDIPIYERVIYSDEIGKPGDVVDTYEKYLNYNLDVIVDGLS